MEPKMRPPYLGDGVTCRIAAIVEAIAKRHSITTNFTYEDLFIDGGLTSVGMVELMLALEGAFVLTILDSELNASAFSSIASLTALLGRLTSMSEQITSSELQHQKIMLFQ